VPQLFYLFALASPGRLRSSGGLGIGLAVVRGLAELHGGSVSAHSEGFGKGSEFRVRLPLADAGPQPASHEARRYGPCLPRGRRILVVEDNVDAAQSLAMLLRLEGSEVEIAHDGVVGLHKACEWRPDAVLLDIGLPFMNGYEVCRALRAEDWARRLPIIALTGWGQEDDRARSREAGFDAHLVKPVELAHVSELLARLLSP
jgi:CheY-like chemotaxis protein